MRRFAATIVASAAILAVSGQRAAACVLWLCDERQYPPMVVPTDDQRIGPTWTRNGFVYPPVYGYGRPMPYADPAYVDRGYSLKDSDRPAAPVPADRPRHWRW
jgi:hypothetical protein